MTPCQVRSSGVVCEVQLTPSGEVITRLPAVPLPAATNRRSSGDHSIEFQVRSLGVVCEVQLTPSGEVIALLFVPERAQATKMPSSGDQQTPAHVWANEVWPVQLIPSGDVATLFVPPIPTAQNKLRAGDQVTSFQTPPAGPVLAVHVMPSGDDINGILLNPAAATNMLAVPAPHVTVSIWPSVGVVGVSRSVQLMPSGDVIARLPDTLPPTATN